MSDMEQFFTRKVANEGIKVPLSLPNGAETAHFFVVRGVDSDAFRDADAASRRVAVLAAGLEDEAERKALLDDSRLDLVIALIADWSFDQECNYENKRRLLIEAPQLRDAVDRIAAKRSLFFGKKSKNSQNTQSLNSDSADPQEGQNKV